MNGFALASGTGPFFFGSFALVANYTNATWGQDTFIVSASLTKK